MKYLWVLFALFAGSLPAQQSPANLQFDLARLTQGTCITNGRIQDSNLKNRQHIMAQIMLNGVNSLEWLGRRIRDSHPVPNPILCGWRGMQVGDVALVVVLDLFKDPDGQSTAHELDWDTFLERSSPSLTPEQVLRGFIRKYRRSGLEKKWHAFWQEHSDQIIWDEQGRCYRMQPGHPR